MVHYLNFGNIRQKIVYVTRCVRSVYFLPVKFEYLLFTIHISTRKFLCQFKFRTNKIKIKDLWFIPKYFFAKQNRYNHTNIFDGSNFISNTAYSIIFGDVPAKLKTKEKDKYIPSVGRSIDTARLQNRLVVG